MPIRENYVNTLGKLYEYATTFFPKNCLSKMVDAEGGYTYEEFKTEIEKGGFILAHWDGTPETEEQIKNDTKATIRCIPLGWDETPGTCMVTGKPSARRVLFARAY